MQEPTIARVHGPDAIRPDWTGGDRSDAAWPDPARSESAQPGSTVVRASGATDASVAGERDPNERDSKQQDAAFPTSYARFSINAETQKLSIKIVDAVTDEVIREIPPEQVQRIAEDLQSLARRAAIGKKPAGTSSIAGGGVDRYV